MTGAGPDVVDRRARRTRWALIGAARSLMRTRAWERVSVRALCDAADVSRSTFYEHFADKPALLEATFAALRAKLDEDVPGRGLATAGTLRCLPLLVAHAKGHLPLFDRNAASLSNHALHAGFRRTVGASVRAEIRTAGLDDPDAPHRDAFVVAGVLGALERWCETRCEAPEASVVAALDDLVDAVLRRR